MKQPLSQKLQLVNKGIKEFIFEKQKKPKLHKLIKELEALKNNGRDIPDILFPHAADDKYPKSLLIKELSFGKLGHLAHKLYQGWYNK